MKVGGAPVVGLGGEGTAVYRSAITSLAITHKTSLGYGEGGGGSKHTHS